MNQQLGIFVESGLDKKIDMAIQRIKTFEPAEGYYVAFSGGKDSIVLKKLVQMSGVKADYHYNVTTVDPPEIIKEIRTNHSEVIFEYPRESMYQLIIRKKMLPTRLMRFCCAELKERGGENRRVLTGVRWDESSRRAANANMVRPCRRQNKITVNPIIDWTDEDVWQFIIGKNIPYCSLYDNGFKRLGCVGCPISGPVGMTREFVKWPGHLRIYFRAAEKILPHILERRDAKGKPVSFTTTKGFFLWWLRDLTKDQRHASVVSKLIDEHCLNGRRDS